MAMGQNLYADGRSSWPVSQASWTRKCSMVSGVQACITKLMCCAGRNGLHNVNLLASDERSDWPHLAASVPIVDDSLFARTLSDHTSGD